MVFEKHFLQNHSQLEIAIHLNRHPTTIGSVISHLNELKDYFRSTKVVFDSKTATMEDMKRELSSDSWREYQENLRYGINMSHTALPEYKALMGEK